MSFFSKYRKAIVAFVTPFLALPFLGWLDGSVEFDVSVVAGAVLAAVTGLFVFFFPNAPQDPQA